MPLTGGWICFDDRNFISICIEEGSQDNLMRSLKRV